MVKKPCARCKLVFPINKFMLSKKGKHGRGSYCRPCFTLFVLDYVRRNKKKVKEYKHKYYRTDEYRKRNRTKNRLRFKNNLSFALRLELASKTPKGNARRILRNAVSNGSIKKPNSCSKCGRKSERRFIHGHHADYEKPLEVKWLCALCHTEEHTLLNEALGECAHPGTCQEFEEGKK